MSPRRRHALKPALEAAEQAVAAALADWPAPGMIIGGVAVIAQGVPRLKSRSASLDWSTS
jgi:hypothetical protein